MITVTPSFNNEQKHRNFVSDVSFSSRTDKNKLALYDSTERIFNDGIVSNINRWRSLTTLYRTVSLS